MSFIDKRGLIIGRKYIYIFFVFRVKFVFKFMGLCDLYIIYRKFKGVWGD